MKINDAIIVDVDFDGDIRFDDEGISVFTGELAVSEAEELVRRALEAMLVGYRKRMVRLDDEKFKDAMLYSDFDGRGVPVSDIINDSALLGFFMEQGGDGFGNWEITINAVGSFGNFGFTE